MIHIASCVVGRETTPQTHARQRVNEVIPKSRSFKSRLTHTGEESIERFSVLVCKCMNAQKMYFPSSVQSGSYKPFNSQLAKDCVDTNISIGFGEAGLYSGKGSSTAFQGHCVFGLYERKVHNLTHVGSSCSRTEVMCYSLMLREYDFPHMITTLPSSCLTRPVPPIAIHVLPDGAGCSCLPP